MGAETNRSDSAANAGPLLPKPRVPGNANTIRNQDAPDSQKDSPRRIGDAQVRDGDSPKRPRASCGASEDSLRGAKDALLYRRASSNVAGDSLNLRKASRNRLWEAEFPHWTELMSETVIGN